MSTMVKEVNNNSFFTEYNDALTAALNLVLDNHPEYLKTGKLNIPASNNHGNHEVMGKKTDFPLIKLAQTLAIIGILITLVLILFRGTLVNSEIAVRALKNQGFTNVEILDKDWLAVGLRGCSSSDCAKFEIKADNSAGKKVNVFVCVGWPFKGATIRSQ